MDTIDAENVIKETKRKVAIVLIAIVVILSGFIYWKFFSLQGVPKGKLIRVITSPDGQYEIKTYLDDTDSLSANAVRGELSKKNSNSTKTIYWNYPDEDPYIEWVNNRTVRIGNQTLDISKNQVYDWRDEEKHSKEKPKQFNE